MEQEKETICLEGKENNKSLYSMKLLNNKCMFVTNGIPVNKYHSHHQCTPNHLILQKYSYKSTVYI